MEAFDQLFQLYGKRLYHFALGYLKSKEEAEEVVQNVFLKIWYKRETLNPDLSFNAYLFKIAYRQITEMLKKIIREKAYIHETIESALNFDNDLNEQVNYRSLLELVEKLVSDLPPRQREVFTLHKMQGMPINETSEKLGISPKTAEHHFTAAMKSIKTSLEKENLRGLLFFYLFIHSKF